MKVGVLHRAKIARRVWAGIPACSISGLNGCEGYRVKGLGPISVERCILSFEHFKETTHDMNGLSGGSIVLNPYWVGRIQWST